MQQRQCQGNIMDLIKTLAPSSWFFWHDEPLIEGESSEKFVEPESVEAQSPKENYFQRLPNEVIRHLFSYLSLRHIVLLKLTCTTWHRIGNTIEAGIQAINPLPFSVGENKYQHSRFFDLFQNRIFFGHSWNESLLFDLKDKKYISPKSVFFPDYRKNKAFCRKREILASFKEGDDTIFLKKISSFNGSFEKLILWNVRLQNKPDDLQQMPYQIIFFGDRIAVMLQCYREKTEYKKIMKIGIDQFVIRTISLENGSSLAERHFPDETLCFFVGDNKNIVCMNKKNEIFVLDLNLKFIKKIQCKGLPCRLDWWCCGQTQLASGILFARKGTWEPYQIIDLHDKNSRWIGSLSEKRIEAFDTDGNYLAIATHYRGRLFKKIRCIEIWDLIHGERVRKIDIENRDTEVLHLRFSKGTPPNMADNFPGFPAYIAIDGVQIWSSSQSC